MSYYDVEMLKRSSQLRTAKYEGVDIYTGKIVFAQLIEHLTLHVFHRRADRCHSDFKVKEVICLDHYFCMVIEQLTHRESLWVIEAGLFSTIQVKANLR